MPRLRSPSILPNAWNMSALRRLLAVGMVVALVSCSGYASGVLANRWSAPDELAQSAALLKAVPKECGAWRMLSETELDPQIVELLACSGYVNRSYRRLQTRDTVHVAIVAGPPGRIAVHTPEICYASQGYHLEQSPARRSFQLPEESRAELTFSSFVPDAVGPEGAGKLLAYHAFSDGGAWRSPAYPRFAFGGRPVLLKLQLATRTSADSQQSLPDPCRDFLEAFLPALRRAGIGR